MRCLVALIVILALAPVQAEVAGVGKPADTSADRGSPNAANLAAAHAYGIVENHRFADGTKRTARICVGLFLADNGYTLAFDKAEPVQMMMSFADGTLDEWAMAGWLRVRMQLIG